MDKKEQVVKHHVVMSQIKDPKFKGYDSIDHARKSFQRKYSSNTLYVVTEKVHGSNFQLTTNGEVFKMGKRSGYHEDGTMFNCKSIVDKYSQNVLDLHKSLFKKGQWMTVFGEIFGGGYPRAASDSVKEPYPTSNTDKTIQSIGIKKPVQKGIYYCPHVDFYAFDIYDHTKNEYLSFQDALALFQQFKFLYIRF